VARTEKIRRKELLEPDEFLTLSRQALEFAQEYRTALLTALGTVLVIAAALFAYRAISASREASAGEAYVAAHTLLVDRKYAEAATALQAIADRYGSTRHAALAQLQAADALLLGGRPEEAALAYQRFLDDGPPIDYLRQAALGRLAYAEEAAGQAAKARETFASAAAAAGPFAEDALYGVARTSLAAGDSARARELYEEFLNKYPTSKRRALVTAALLKLGWTPPARSANDSADAADAAPADAPGPADQE